MIVVSAIIAWKCTDAVSRRNSAVENDAPPENKTESTVTDAQNVRKKEKPIRPTPVDATGSKMIEETPGHVDED